MSAGYAGVENTLYFQDNCSMVFGDAKDVCEALARELQGGGH
jgi:NAD(P) transhydrogenase subunit beta